MVRNRFNITGFILIAAVIMMMAFSAVTFADTTITTTSTSSPYFHTWSSNPIASLFYLIGDIVVLPFRLIGDLFN